MHRLYLVLPVVTLSMLSCHSPILVGQKTIGGVDKDEPQSICLAKDGGYIVAGNSFSRKSGEKLSDNRGYIYSDYWVIKFSAKGEMQWQKTIGGDNTDYARSIAATTDGGYVIAGESESDSSGDKTENSRGGPDIWVVKIDSVGNVIWDKTLGGSSAEVCTTIKQTKDGGYVVGAASNSNISGEKTEPCRGDFDFWILKLDSKGNLEWNKTIGGNKFEYCGGLELSDNDDIIICGTTGSDSFPEKNGSHFGCWIAKLNIQGQLLWQKFYGAVGMFIGISKAEDNGFILSAFSSSNKSADKSENCRGGNDIWIVKTDINGNKIWDKTIGGKDDDSPWCIKQTIDGGYIVGGMSNSGISGDKTDSCRGNYDCWVIKLSNKGKIEWDKTIGGNDYDIAKDIAETAKGHFIIMGISFSDKSGDKTDTTRGEADFWLAYLNE